MLPERYWVTVVIANEIHIGVETHFKARYVNWGHIMSLNVAQVGCCVLLGKSLNSPQNGIVVKILEKNAELLNFLLHMKNYEHNPKWQALSLQNRKLWVPVTALTSISMLALMALMF